MLVKQNAGQEIKRQPEQASKSTLPSPPFQSGRMNPRLISVIEEAKKTNMNLTFTYARLLVSDYRACFGFYHDVLGFEATFGDADSGYADFNTGSGATIALFDRQEMAQGIGADAADDPAGKKGVGRIALVFAVPDVDEACRQLQAEGVALAAFPTDHPEWGIRTAHVRDPEGNLIEINQNLG